MNTTQALCNSCGQITEHEVIHEEVCSVEELCSVEKEKVTETRNKEVLSCRGCKEFLIREEIPEATPENGNKSIQKKFSYIPPRLWRQRPTWLVELDQIDPDLKSLLEEIYSATNERQSRLLSMGIRAALDHMMTIALNGDVGNFQNKLDKMVEEGNLTKNQADNIKIVIDAGSASSHRGFKPPRELIEEMVIVMESLLREHYVTGPMLKTARHKIPPRP